MAADDKHPFTDAEAALLADGATKIVSLWYDEPALIAVLVDGRTLVVDAPHLVVDTDPPPDRRKRLEAER